MEHKPQHCLLSSVDECRSLRAEQSGLFAALRKKEHLKHGKTNPSTRKLQSDDQTIDTKMPEKDFATKSGKI